MLIIGLDINLRILLLKLSYILFNIISVKPSSLMCLAHFVVESLGCPLKHNFDQNTRMILPKVVIEVPTANLMFILWPVINESLYQPLSQTVSEENM